jgi:hypothetical protein
MRLPERVPVGATKVRRQSLLDLEADQLLREKIESTQYSRTVNLALREYLENL